MGRLARELKRQKEKIPRGVSDLGNKRRKAIRSQGEQKTVSSYERIRAKRWLSVSLCVILRVCYCCATLCVNVSLSPCEAL
jgi:hypothetical protein